MKILVGIPVFRLPDSVCWSIDPLLNTPATVLIIDNNADADVKQAIKKYEGKTEIIRNVTNTYCNGAWNQILKFGIEHQFDVIGLGTDLILRTGWYDVLTTHMKSSIKEVCLPRIVADSKEDFNAKVADNIAGPMSFFTREAAQLVYPIPMSLKHWYGDTYMFGKLRAHGWKTIVLGNLKADHPWSQVTYRTPEAYTVIEQDKIEWQRLWDTKELSY